MDANTVENGWTITEDNDGWSACLWVDSVGMVAIWQPTFSELLQKMSGYNGNGAKLK